MVKDLNREITSIEYNSLNLRPKAVKIGCTSEKKEKSSLFSLLSTRFALSLPRQITFSDDTKMKLTYDAAGNKLRAEYWTIPTFNPGGPIGPVGIGGGDEPMGGGIVGPILPPINQNDPQVVTDYCGNLIYRNDTLTMLLMEEGYVTFATSGTPTYHYYLKDHLGSVRIVMSQDGTVEQRNQYYPDGTLFGKQSTNGTVQPYKFGQKELERTLPLDEYDFGARWMNPVVGARFGTPDPLAEKYPWSSPYAYCGGDPVNAVDPDGRNPIYDLKGNFLGTDSRGLQGNYYVLDKQYFTQGMSPLDVGKFAVMGDISSEVESKINEHYEKLPYRPDYDGFVSIIEGIRWAKLHPGALANPTPDNTLYIDASQLDFGNLSVDDFKYTGRPEAQNLFTNSNLFSAISNPILAATIYALGRVNMILNNRDSKSVTIVNDSATDYDWNEGGGTKRNVFIKANNYMFDIDPSIHGFKTFYYGTGRLNR